MSGSMDELDNRRLNVIEMTVRVQAAKEKLRVPVLHFGQELFATIGLVAAKHGYDALNVRNNLVSI